ncbi:hypothetical protein K413DRAFT_3009 [Clostridium sp. ASBs410]|nr:hypothetical protein K413DRAFT_3009 [Clostridium sp. ASBs410]
MCNCMNEMEQKLVDKVGCGEAYAPVELLSGGVYLKFTVRRNGKKDKEVPVMLSKCPICGKEYETD